MTVDTAIRLKLGDIEFREFEVPEELPFGGRQTLKVHRFVGNSRAIDAMGYDPDPIRWAGRFRGPDAISRAKALEAMAATGREYALTCGELAYTVVIEEFEARQVGAREVPYSIRCEVKSDDAAPGAQGASIGPTQMVGADFLSASGIAGRVGSSLLTGSLATLGTAIKGVGNFATAGKAALTSVLGPLFRTEDVVSGLISGAESVLAGGGGLAGIVAGGNPADMAEGLLAHLGAMTQSADLHDIQGYLGRIDTNVSAVGSSGAAITVAGADLFRLAKDVYGDASEWSTIAAANGFSDPVISGITKLVLPPTPTGAGGVLG
jgi:hypothetical protein